MKKAGGIPMIIAIVFSLLLLQGCSGKTAFTSKSYDDVSQIAISLYNGETILERGSEAEAVFNALSDITGHTERRTHDSLEHDPAYTIIIIYSDSTTDTFYPTESGENIYRFVDNKGQNYIIGNTGTVTEIIGQYASLEIDYSLNEITILPMDSARVKPELPLIIIEGNLYSSEAEITFRQTPDADVEPFPIEIGKQFYSLVDAYQADTNDDGVYEAYATFLVGSGNPWCAISGYDPVSQLHFFSSGLGECYFIVFEGELFVQTYERSFFSFQLPDENSNTETTEYNIYRPVINEDTLGFDFEEISDELALRILDNQ